MRLKYFLLLLLFPLASLPVSGVAGTQELDMDEYLYGHIRDAYEWHITTVNGHPVSIPLPVILFSKASGWHCFSSRHLEGGESWQGFFIAPAGEKHENKIV